MVTKVTYPERVLIVLNQDGTFKAAHQELLTVIFDDDGSKLAHKPHGAVAVEEKSLIKILPDVASTIAQLQSSIDEHKNTQKSLEDKNTESNNKDFIINSLKTQMFDLQKDHAQQVDALKTEIVELGMTIREKTAQISKLEALKLEVK